MIALVELKGTSMERTHYGIAHFFMELYAVKGEILVFFFGIGDAGIEVCYMLCRKELFKGGVEFCTYAFAVKSSWRNITARIRVMTTLSLSMGATFETLPIWIAL